MKVHNQSRAEPGVTNDMNEGAITPSATTDAPRRYLRRQAAALYVRERWGLPCQPSWLAKLAVVGGGPVFRRCGRIPVYEEVALDEWARSRLSAPMRSTSESCPAP